MGKKSTNYFRKNFNNWTIRTQLLFSLILTTVVFSVIIFSFLKVININIIQFKLNIILILV